MLKEQWIRAKYERKEFTESANKFTYEEGKWRHTRSDVLKARVKKDVDIWGILFAFYIAFIIFSNKNGVKNYVMFVFSM